jgi:hypothetical protein
MSLIDKSNIELEMLMRNSKRIMVSVILPNGDRLWLGKQPINPIAAVTLHWDDIKHSWTE